MACSCKSQDDVGLSIILLVVPSFAFHSIGNRMPTVEGCLCAIFLNDVSSFVVLLASWSNVV